MAERLTPLQQQEVDLALCRLTAAGVDLIRGHKLNYLQMREIRLGLERGMSIEQVKPVARRWIDHADMKELLAAIEAGEDVQIPRRPAKVIPLIVTAALGAVIAAGMYLYVSLPVEELTVPLLQKEIRLSTGMTFDPKSYVKQALLPSGIVLSYPDSFVCTVPEVRLVVYRASRGDRAVDAVLRIVIVDETAPSLKLKQSEVTVGKDEAFSCAAFIEEAVDEVDGDLMGSVECSDELKPQYDQEVLYQLKDRSGNVQQAFLLVLQEEYAESTADEILPEINDVIEIEPVEEAAVTLPSPSPASLPGDDVYEETEIFVSESVEVQSSDVTVSHDTSF